MKEAMERELARRNGSIRAAIYGGWIGKVVTKDGQEWIRVTNGSRVEWSWDGVRYYGAYWMAQMERRNAAGKGN